MAGEREKEGHRERGAEREGQRERGRERGAERGMGEYRPSRGAICLKGWPGRVISQLTLAVGIGIPHSFLSHLSPFTVAGHLRVPFAQWPTEVGRGGGGGVRKLGWREGGRCGGDLPGGLWITYLASISSFRLLVGTYCLQLFPAIWFAGRFTHVKIASLGSCLGLCLFLFGFFWLGSFGFGFV